MKQPIRNAFFWIHLVVGVSSSFIVVMLCVTGAILAFELPITVAADRALVEVPAEHEALPNVESLTAVAAESRVGTPPESVRVGAAPNDPVVASWGRRDQMLLNPWTGESLGEGASGTHAFFRTTMTVHRWFALEGAGRDAARLVTGIAALLMVLLVPTGLLLWVPRRLTWKKVRGVIIPKVRRYGQALEYQWHHVFGFWMALPLLFVALTGAAIGFEWLNQGLVKLGGGAVAAEGPPHGPGHGGGDGGDAVILSEELTDSLNEALAVAAQEIPGWNAIRVAIPEAADTVVEVTVDSGNGRQLQAQQNLTISRTAPRVVGRSSWAAEERERKIRVLIRFGHTGEMFGWPGILLAAFASIAGALLAYTGLALSTRRLLRWRRRLHDSSNEGG